MAAAGAAVNNTNKKVIFKNVAPFTDCITEINNTQIDHAQKIGVVMPRYNLIEYRDAYLKTLGSLWQYDRDKPALDNNGNIIGFPDDSNNSASFKFIQTVTGQTENSGTKDVEIMVPLKYLSNLWRTLEVPLISCEISLQLKWSRNCIIVAGTANLQNPTFEINDAKHYVSVVTLLTQENIKRFKLLESCFKRTINWNKYLAKTTNQAITVEIKDFNVMIDGRNFFGQKRKNEPKTYGNIRKYFNRSRRWLCNWLFARLSLFQKIP